MHPVFFLLIFVWIKIRKPVFYIQKYHEQGILSVEKMLFLSTSNPRLTTSIKSKKMLKTKRKTNHDQRPDAIIHSTDQFF